MHGRSRVQTHEYSGNFCGDFYNLTPVNVLGSWASEIARFVLCDKVAGRPEKMEIMELASVMMIQQERAEVRILLHFHLDPNSDLILYF